MTEPSRPSVVQNCRRGSCAAKPNVTAKSTKPVRMAAAFMNPLYAAGHSIIGGFRVAMTHLSHVSIERAVARDPKRMTGDVEPPDLVPGVNPYIENMNSIQWLNDIHSSGRDDGLHVLRFNGANCATSVHGAEIQPVFEQDRENGLLRILR